MLVLLENMMGLIQNAPVNIYYSSLLYHLFTLVLKKSGIIQSTPLLFTGALAISFHGSSFLIHHSSILAHQSKGLWFVVHSYSVKDSH